MAILGLASLAVAIAAGVSVVPDVLYGEVVRIPVTVGVLVWLTALWFALPRRYSTARGNDG